MKKPISQSTSDLASQFALDPIANLTMMNFWVPRYVVEEANYAFT